LKLSFKELKIERKEDFARKIISHPDAGKTHSQKTRLLFGEPFRKQERKNNKIKEKLRRATLWKLKNKVGSSVATSSLGPFYTRQKNKYLEQQP